MNQEIADCPDCHFPLRSVPCPRCAEKKEEDARKSARYAAFWGGARARDTFTFEGFQETPTNQDARKIAQSFDPSVDNLFFHGPTGVGKSHLAVAAARRFFRSGACSYQVVWKAARISRTLRAADGAIAEQDFLDQLGNQRILIIDDIGVEKRSDFMDSTLYEIIETRDMTGKGGLIMTSNLSLDELAALLKDTRLVSRLSRNCKVVDLSQERDFRSGE